MVQLASMQIRHTGAFVGPVLEADTVKRILMTVLACLAYTEVTVLTSSMTSSANAEKDGRANFAHLVSILPV